LSEPSSHLRKPPQVPERADRIEWIDDTRTRSTGIMVLKVERPRQRQLDLFVFVFALILLRASPSRRMGIAALFVIAPGHGMLRLARLERLRLRLLSTLIPDLFSLGCRSISNLGLLDSIGKWY
jgi:hypothetical protein